MRTRLALVLLALVPVAVAETAFAPIPTDEPVSDFALTEDGKQLVVAEQTGNRLAIVDLASGAVTKTVSCPAPHAVL
jgi:hypothetical protein